MHVDSDKWELEIIYDEDYIEVIWLRIDMDYGKRHWGRHSTQHY